MKRLALLLLLSCAAPVHAAEGFIEDCGLEPPGSYVPNPPPPKQFEAPRVLGEPPQVRRELRVAQPEGLKGVPTARLRSGALSGKTVYLSAGHGFTWTSTVNGWRTQRPNTHSIVEDLVSTETVAQFLVPMLLNAGALVFTVRESDLNSKMVIVDDLSPEYAETGAATLFSDSTIPGFGMPPTPMSGTVTPFGLAKNRLMDAAATATASASWAPTIPADGYYNVYISYSQYPARVSDAHYVVKHAEGEAHFRVNQRRHGGTWILLGRFFFRAGKHAATASVVALNDSASGTGNVSLDAVRFGGGMGLIARGTGPSVSGRPRFEESCRYHAQFAGAPASVFGSGDDRTDDVSCRSKFAAWDHEAGEDAIYLAWHTNAFNGVAVGTDIYVYGPNPADGSYNFTGVPGSDTLAQAVHSEMINDIRLGWGPTTWKDRGIHSAYFGEINPSHNSEMPSILMEVAFHDAASDAAQLKEPGFRYVAARSIAQGIIKWFADKDGATAALPPEPPTGLSAVNKGGGVVALKWHAPAVDSQGVKGQAATSYVIYSSADGLAWDEGIEVSATSRSIPLTPGGVRYFRVSGLNAGGESFPSDVVGVGVAVDAPVPLLVVNAFDRLEASLGQSEDLSAYTLGSILRIFVEKMNDGTYVRQHGDAISFSSVAFDSATSEAVVAGDVALTPYPVVDWIAGRGHAQGKPPSAAERQALSAYLVSGKALLVSGSHLASGLAAGASAEQAFLQQVLHASSAAGGGTLLVDGDSAEFLAGLSGLVLDDGTRAVYPTGAADALSAGGFSLARYSGTSRSAAVGYSGTGKVVFLGFPFETLASRADRLEVMGRSLKFFGVTSVVPPLPDAGQPDSGVEPPLPDAGGVDAGEPPPVVLAGLPESYEYALKGGCGCTAAGGAMPAAIGVLLAIARARRRRTCGGVGPRSA